MIVEQVEAGQEHPTSTILADCTERVFPDQGRNKKQNGLAFLAKCFLTQAVSVQC